MLGHSSPVRGPLALLFALQTLGVLGLHLGARPPPFELAMLVGVCAAALALPVAPPRAATWLAAAGTGAMVVLTALDVARADFAPWVVPLAHAIRFILPLAIWAQILGTSPFRVRRLLRVGAAAVFIGHGLECLLQNPFFLSLLIEVPPRLLGLVGLPRMSLSAETAGGLLYLIGLQDVLLGAAYLAGPSRPAGLYMGFWGFLTAAARIGFFGLEVGWPHFLVRTSNGASPLLALEPKGRAAAGTGHSGRR